LRGEVAPLLARATEEGSLPLSELEGLAEKLGLDDDQVEALYEEIDERGLAARSRPPAGATARDICA
jgi:hypothetical protein